MCCCEDDVCVVRPKDSTIATWSSPPVGTDSWMVNIRGVIALRGDIGLLCDHFLGLEFMIKCNLVDVRATWGHGLLNGTDSQVPPGRVPHKEALLHHEEGDDRQGQEIVGDNLVVYEDGGRGIH